MSMLMPLSKFIDHVELTIEVEDENTEDEEVGCCARGIGRVQSGLRLYYHEYYYNTWNGIYLFFLNCYGAYFIGAMWFSFGDEGSLRLLGMTCVIVFFTIIAFANLKFGKTVYDNTIKPVKNYFVGDKCGKKIATALKWIFIAIVIGLIIYFLVFEVGMKEPYNLVGLAGLAGYILLFYICSHNPAKVKWRPVIWGLLLQFVFALLILRTRWGFLAFRWLGERVTEFLLHTDFGSKFVFGNIELHFFAFKLLPVVVFFSTIISLLYYLGWMQVVIRKVAWVMQITMGTTAGESLNAAGNIFIGQSEAPLLIRPLIQNMTRSEIHAVMTGGFATIAGSVLGAFIFFGAPANHLLSASVMSAPAALAMAKLFYPETEKSRTTAKDVVHMEKSQERNIIDALSTGASQSIKLVANIAVNLIAFLAVLHFLNGTLEWLGRRVGLGVCDDDPNEEQEYPCLSLELISSYLFCPLALMMGTTLQHCRQMGHLIGLKTFLNEFVAYDYMGQLIRNSNAHLNYTQIHNITHLTPGVPAYDAAVRHHFDDIIHLLNNSRVLKGGVLDERSTVIATYALCGFANFGSVGIMVAALTAMAPNRKSDIASWSVAMRAMIAGNVACFMTACIAGLLYSPASVGITP
ncbi:solute carrier family 28 member 3-like isoform X2 [Lineus longissimus]|uniref:solute carrier family 28 member 3-like isoform X2 n=1 Tax=Lineus longissimus TaxID=88925 RepID=UPI00315C64EA